MANQDYQIPGSKSIITREGQNDILPLAGSPHWFKVNGIIGIFGKLERLTGKRLSFTLQPDSVISIHSNNQGQVFVQTNLKLYMYQEYELLTDLVSSDTDGSDVIDDLTGQHVLNA